MKIEDKQLVTFLECNEHALTQALAYGDALDTDNYAEYWSHTEIHTHIDWRKLRRALRDTQDLLKQLRLESNNDPR
jgi:hypothetical protein